MDFDEYQEKIKEFDLYKPDKLTEVGFIEKVLGLTGEAGETADKVKKVLRDKDGSATDEDKKEIVKELGDVIWYVASIARYLDIPFSEVAKMNVEKLTSRKERNKLHGAGDNR